MLWPFVRGVASLAWSELGRELTHSLLLSGWTDLLDNVSSHQGSICNSKRPRVYLFLLLYDFTPHFQPSSAVSNYFFIILFVAVDVVFGQVVFWFHWNFFISHLVLWCVITLLRLVSDVYIWFVLPFVFRWYCKFKLPLIFYYSCVHRQKD